MTPKEVEKVITSAQKHGSIPLVGTREEKKEILRAIRNNNRKDS